MASERYVRIWDKELGKTLRAHRVAAELISTSRLSIFAPSAARAASTESESLTSI